MICYDIIYAISLHIEGYKRMKKSLMAVFAVLVLLVGGLGFYFGFSNKSEIDLEIKLNNLKVYCGECVKIDYKCSIADAVVALSVEDKSLATIELKGDGYYIRGDNAGETKIVLKASYGKYKNQTQALLVVEDKNDGNSDKNEQDNSGVDNKIDKPENDVVNPEENKGNETTDKFYFYNFNEIEYSEDVFYMSKLKQGWFSIIPCDSYIFNGPPVISCESTYMNISNIVNDNTFMFYCEKNGDYIITIEINNILYNFDLIVR